MGRNALNKVIINQICTKCKINKIVRQTPTGEKRLYYYGGKGKKCEHNFINNNGTQPNPATIIQIKPTNETQTKPTPVIQATATPQNNDKESTVEESHEYVPRRIGDKKDTQILQYCFEQRLPVRITGDAGTGKNHAIRTIAKTNKIRYYPFSCNGGSSPDQFIGHYVPTTNGTFQWQDGILTDYVKNGGIFVVDEINSANAEMLFFLHQLTDDHKQLTLTDKDGTVIKAHPDFWICATMNPDYEGTKPVNEALKDRFISLDFDYSEEAEKKLIKNAKLLEFAKSIRAMHRQLQIRTPFGTRELLKFQKISEGLSEKVAVEVMLSHFEPTDRQVVRESYEVIVQQKTRKPVGEVAKPQ